MVSLGKGQADDVHHVTSEPSYQDFRHYMDDPENATARTNLHSGDVEIIEAAFGVDLGISGSTSVQGVVSAAMSPVTISGPTRLCMVASSQRLKSTMSLRRWGRIARWRLKSW